MKKLALWFLNQFFPVPADPVGDLWREMADAKIARKAARVTARQS